MSDDMIARLRQWSEEDRQNDRWDAQPQAQALVTEAADEITRLRAELAEMSTVAEDAITQVEKTNTLYMAAVEALAALRAQRCGTCADGAQPWLAEWHRSDRVRCQSEHSECRAQSWGTSHSCPHWRQREEGR